MKPQNRKSWLCLFASPSALRTNSLLGFALTRAVFHTPLLAEGKLLGKHYSQHYSLVSLESGRMPAI